MEMMKLLMDAMNVKSLVRVLVLAAALQAVVNAIRRVGI